MGLIITHYSVDTNWKNVSSKKLVMMFHHAPPPNSYPQLLLNFNFFAFADVPWQSWKRLGERMAGQRNLRKMEPLISLKQASSLSAPNR